MKTQNFLRQYLVDSHAVLLKTQSFHWNVSGTQFYDLHLMFEDQYNDLFKAIDVIAERIRALGEPAPGGLMAYASMTSINDPEEKLCAKDMINALIFDHQLLRDQALNDTRYASQGGDDATAEILISRIQQHEKCIWMMKSVIDDETEETPDKKITRKPRPVVQNKTFFQTPVIFQDQRKEKRER